MTLTGDNSSQPMQHILRRSYTHRFPRSKCCPTSASLPRFKNLVRGNQTWRWRPTCRPRRPTCPISSSEKFGHLERENRCV